MKICMTLMLSSALMKSSIYKVQNPKAKLSTILLFQWKMLFVRVKQEVFRSQEWAIKIAQYATKSSRWASLKIIIRCAGLQTTEKQTMIYITQQLSRILSHHLSSCSPFVKSRISLYTSWSRRLTIWLRIVTSRKWQQKNSNRFQKQLLLLLTSPV